MGTFGTLFMYAALLFIVVTVAVSIAAARKSDDGLARIAEYATYGTAITLSAAVGVLQLALMTLDFSLMYVAEYTSTTLSVPYRIGSMWAGQGGSLLLWAWMVSLCAAWITYANRAKGWQMSPYTMMVFAVVAGLFAVLTTFFSSPFVAATEVMTEGFGLNPLLQDPLQIIHPLALYAGYVLYTVPFAIVVGALLAGDVSGPWVKIATRWNVLAWIALTAGIVLGARWAYAELGWGGYWAWDPVENASLLPWLTGTMALHTGLTLRGSPRLRLASVIIVMVTFSLCLFGTFLTRSGVVSSVHAFGESNMGSTLGAAIAAIVIACGALVVWRLPQLRVVDPDRRSHGWLGQLILLILLTAITVAVLWGTLFPLFNRVINGEEIAVTPGFFRVVVTPMGIAILGLFAISPLLPGQAVVNRGREIGIRVAVFLVVFGGIMLVTHGANFGVALVLALSALSLMTVVRKAKPRLIDAWQNDAAPLWGAVRASGPYVGHVGLVIMLAAITLNVAFQLNGQGKVALGETATIGGTVVRLEKVEVNGFADRDSFMATVTILGADGSPVGIVRPKLEQFSNAEQLHAEVGILATPATDIYVVVDEADATPGAEFALLTVYDNPAVVWIWIGGTLLTLGGVLFAIPRRRRVDVVVDDGRGLDDADADLAELLDAAIVAARAPRAAGAAAPSDAVAELLAKAEDLSRPQGQADSDPDEVVAFLEQAKQRLGGADPGVPAQGTSRSAGGGRPPGGAATPGSGGKPNRTALYVIGGLIALLVIGGGAYALGQASGSDLPGIEGTPTNAASAAPSTSAAPVDQAAVGALMEKIAADPQDAESLLALGDIYFNAADYKNAATFYDKVVVITPENDDAWVASGAAAFNNGDSAAALTAWQTAVEVNPKNAEAFYDLGFLYLSQNENDKAKEAWEQVIAIDPTSDLAKTVESHLDSLSTPAPTPSAS